MSGSAFMRGDCFLYHGVSNELIEAKRRDPTLQRPAWDGHAALLDSPHLIERLRGLCRLQSERVHLQHTHGAWAQAVDSALFFTALFFTVSHSCTARGVGSECTALGVGACTPAPACRRG